MTKDERSWACGTHGGKHMFIPGFGGEGSRKETTWMEGHYEN